MMRAESVGERPATSGSYSRNLESSQSRRSLPATFNTMQDLNLDKHNLGVARPRKLTPLDKMPLHNRFDQYQQKNQHRPLHLSVNYKATLDPIEHGGRVRKQTFIKSPSLK